MAIVDVYSMQAFLLLLRCLFVAQETRWCELTKDKKYKSGPCLLPSAKNLFHEYEIVDLVVIQMVVQLPHCVNRFSLLRK